MTKPHNALEHSDTVPKSALQMGSGFELGPQNLGDNDENRFEILARTGDAIDHWFWGKIVHDLDGMQIHKGKLAIDYRHNPDEMIGYADEFDPTTGDLWLRGNLVSFQEDDRAAEVLHKSRAGIPYEASITFDDPLELEEIKPFEKVTVNNREFVGPLVVVRKWSLRGCAVCPHGYDRNTLTKLDNETGTVPVSWVGGLEGAKEMAEQANTTDPQTIEGQNSKSESELRGEIQAEFAATFKKFGDRFGAKAGELMNAGLTYSQALEKEFDAAVARVAELETEVGELKEKLSAVELGEQTAVETVPSGSGNEPADKHPRLNGTRKTFANRFDRQLNGN